MLLLYFESKVFSDFLSVVLWLLTFNSLWFMMFPMDRKLCCLSNCQLLVTIAIVIQLAQLAVQLTGSAETGLQAQSTEIVAIYNAWTAATNSGGEQVFEDWERKCQQRAALEWTSESEAGKSAAEQGSAASMDIMMRAKAQKRI